MAIRSCGKHIFVTVAIVAFAVPPMGAQVTTQTECERNAWDAKKVTCTSRTRDTDRYRRERRESFDRFMESLDNQRRTNAEIARIRAEIAADERARDREDRASAEATDKDDARFDLFVQRTQLIRERNLRALHLFGAATDQYWGDAGDVLLKLYKANPLASNAEIREALEPLDDRYRRRNGRFFTLFGDAVSKAMKTYEIPARDYDRFADSAWVRASDAIGMDFDARPILVLEPVHEAARDFVVSAAPQKRTKAKRTG